MIQDMARTKSLHQNKTNERVSDKGSTRAKNQMNVSDEAEAGARHIKCLENKAPLYSSSQVKKSTNAFEQILIKNTSKFAKSTKKVANNNMVLAIKHINTGMYISESSRKNQATEHLNYKKWIETNQWWTKEIPAVSNTMRI